MMYSFTLRNQVLLKNWTNIYDLKLIEFEIMLKEKWKNLVIYFNISFLIFGIIFLLLNLSIISVTHAKASESLPVEKFETYSSLNISLFYILIFLLIVNLLSIKVHKLKAFRPYVFSFTPIIILISIFLLILSPHSMILNPSGWPPTRLDSIELGGVILLALVSLVLINTLFQLYLEGFMKKYLITLGMVVGALLFSDLIHESGHAILALLSGGEITEFYPFPVLLGGEFAAGYVGFSNVPSNLVPLVLLGGEIFQWITIGILLIFLYFKPKYRNNLFIATLLFIGLLDFPLYVINNSIGLPHWFFIGGINGDLIMFSILTGFPLWVLIILACVQLIITGLIFYKFFLKNRENTAREDFTIQ